MPSDNTRAGSLTTAGLNLIAQALSIYDRDLRLVECNARFVEMFDLPAALTTPGAAFADTIRHLLFSGEYGEVDDVEAFVALRVDQARTFEAHYMERTRANGRTISVEGSPLREGGWVTVYTDITQQRQVQHLLRARSEELSEQLIGYADQLSATNRELAATITALEKTKRELTRTEARIRLTTEMMPAHIAHVDAAGRYTYTNRQLGTVMPGRPKRLVGRHIGEALGDETFARIGPSLAQAIGGAPSVIEFNDGVSSRRIRAAFTPDPQGGAYILSTDITEETRARSALQQTRRRELAAQMSSGLAHDFSNLLTIIMGMQSKLTRMDLPPEAAALVEATQGAARRGGRLLERIGNITGQRGLRLRPSDVGALLADLRVLAEPALPRGVGLSVLDHLPRGLLMLDAGMLHDALLNLVLNARDACGRSGQITVSARQVSDLWLELSVTDTGPGFSAQALEQAADPFFTTKGGEGSGLGLPMVYDMTKMAGGDLQFGNGIGGAWVSLRLPWQPAPPVQGGLALLAEDSDPLREEVRQMLMALDHSVIEAASVDEALALMADLPDLALVLSDIRLKGDATGLDLQGRARASGIPAILMTSLPETDPLYVRARARGPVLRKPFSRSDLAALLTPGVAI